MKDCIRYAAGYRYQLRHTYSIATGIEIPESVTTDWLSMTKGGQLTIAAGYASDGASGTTIDTKSSMRGAFTHDAGYQLIRLGLIPADTREKWDDLFYQILLEDGMWKPRAWMWFHAVRTFGKPSTDPAAEAPDECAGRGCP